VDARGLIADEQLSADLAVSQAGGEQGENFDLARRQLEPLQRGIRRRPGSTSLAELDASTAGERSELAAQGLGVQFVRYRVGVADERFNLRAIAAGGE
jgi:hypothetical protein